MATLTSTSELRKLMGAYGTTLAGRSLDMWSQMVADARTFTELQTLARTYLPPLWKITADQVGVLAADIYMNDRNILFKPSAGSPEASFSPVSPLMGTKISKTINTLTVGLRDITQIEVDKLFEKIATTLAKEAQQLPYDKLKSSWMVNGLNDSAVVSMQLTVSSNACAFCCLVASGTSGTRRVAPGGFSTGRAADRRLSRNLDLFSEGLQSDYQAHIHLNCNCIYRPVYLNGETYYDEDSDLRLANFQDAYYEAMSETGLRSTDIRGKGGLLSEIRKLEA